MNEKQKEEMGKRLFEILKEMGYIQEVQYLSPLAKYLEMKFRIEEEWIRVLTEAIRIYEVERLAKAWEKHKKWKLEPNVNH